MTGFIIGLFIGGFAGMFVQAALTPRPTPSIPDRIPFGREELD